MSNTEERLQSLQQRDAIDLYFECITQCSLSDQGIECVTECVSIHLKGEVD